MIRKRKKKKKKSWQAVDQASGGGVLQSYVTEKEHNAEKARCKKKTSTG